jgi:hypothetical protein
VLATASAILDVRGRGAQQPYDVQSRAANSSTTTAISAGLFVVFTKGVWRSQRLGVRTRGPSALLDNSLLGGRSSAPARSQTDGDRLGIVMG